MGQSPAETVLVPPPRNQGVRLRVELANSSPNLWSVTQTSSPPTDTRAQRSARTGAAEGAGARAATQPSPQATSHPAALHLTVGRRPAPKPQGCGCLKKSPTWTEGPFRVKYFYWLLPCSPHIFYHSRFWGPKCNKIPDLRETCLALPHPQIIHVKDSIQCILYSVLLQNLTTINLPVQIKKVPCKGTEAWHYR